MKYLFTCYILLLSVNSYAQDGPVSISRELAALINVPALAGNTTPGAAAHSGNIIHFDKCILISPTGGQGNAETYLYINTRNGEIATRTGPAGTLGDGSLEIGDEKFTLTHYSPLGTVTIFQNRKKKDIITHYYTTLNTEVSSLSFNAFEQSNVQRSGASKTVLPQGFSAMPYTAGGPVAPVLYLCGGPSPANLSFKRFIGFSGIGYVKTDRGIYMITEMRSAGKSFKATKWQQVNIDLDMSSFVSSEAEMYATIEQKTDRQLAQLENRTFKGDCADIERQLVEMKKANTRNARTEMQNSRAGNFVTDTAALMALMNTVSPERQLEEMLLGLDLSLCRMEAKEAKTGKTEPAKKACIIQNKQHMEQVLIRMRSLRASSSSMKDRMQLQKEKKDLLFQSTKEFRKCN